MSSPVRFSHSLNKTIDRVMRGADIFFLVRSFGSNLLLGLGDSLSYQADMDPTKRLQSLSTDRGLDLFGVWLSSCHR